MILHFELGRWDMAEGSEQAVIVEPPDPFEGGEFDIFDPGPWTARID